MTRPAAKVKTEQTVRASFRKAATQVQMLRLLPDVFLDTELNLSNPITGAKWFATYQADVNMNGTFDETGDTIKDKNLYCLISPLSFSCGNMVPAVLKDSGRVTLLGAKSSGGTSVVQHSSTADGTQFRMSSKYIMSVAKNGSAYDIDQGIEPLLMHNS